MSIQNLPSQVTSFVGRENDITEITSRLQSDSCRLLTLLGTGGVGKTRLSIASTLQLSEDTFPDGIVFVSLAPLRLADDVITEIITILGILVGDDVTPYDALVSYLRQRKILLILDNMEHLLPHAIDLIANIVRDCPTVTLLVTSRERLFLQAEHLWHVRGLPYPDEPDNTQNGYTAITLFDERAKRIQPTFNLNTNREHVQRICQIVDGLPLAIELATSWLSSLTPEQIVNELENGIDLLTTRNRDMPDRHRSMRATFDYSWQRLTNKEQAVFCKLSIFRDGFTLEASIAIADANLVVLSSLIEKSMIRTYDNGRYDLHELLREYAAEKNNTLGKLHTLWQGYTRYYADFVINRILAMKGQRQLEGLDEIQADFENIQVAWYRAWDGDSATVHQMAEGLFLFCLMRSRIDSARHLFTTNYDISQVLRARLQSYWHLLCMTFGIESQHYPDMMEQADIQLNHAMAESDLHMIAIQSWILLWGAWRINDYKQSSLYFERIPLENLTDRFYVSRLLHRHGTSHVWLRKPDEAYDLFTQSLYLARDTGDQLQVAWVLVELTLVTTDATEEMAFAEEAVQIMRDHNNRNGLGTALYVYGTALYRFGYFHQTQVVADEIYSLAGKVDSPIIRAFYESLSVFLTMSRGDYQATPVHWQNTYHLMQHPEALFVVSYPLAIALHEREEYSRYQEVCRQLANDLYPDKLDIYNFHNIYGIASWAWLLLLAMGYASGGIGEKNPERATELLGIIQAHLKLNLKHPPAWLGQIDIMLNLFEGLAQTLTRSRFDTIFEKAHTHNYDAEFTKELRRFAPHSDDSESAIQQANQALIEPLTDRELEILGLIADGLSNADIGGQLYISEGTVKKHVFNLYQKLDVKRRAQAIARARELGLLR